MEGKEPRAAPPPNPAVPYREDCWSEGATSALIDAWGERYLELERGSLRQKHWQEVADAVNSRRTAFKRPARTDVQCKNRVDTIKKKYKAERARIVESGGAAKSQWAFYDRLDALIGDSAAFSKNAASSADHVPVAVPLARRRNSPLPPPPAAGSRPKRPPPDSFLGKGIYSVAAAAAAAAAAEEDEVDSESSKSSMERSTMAGTRVMNGGSGGGGDGDNGAAGVKELARAIIRFAEIYERVESTKQQQMLELEKQRMEFTKGLEFKRMQMFVDTQVQLEKIKRTKHVSDSYDAEILMVKLQFDALKQMLWSPDYT